MKADSMAMQAILVETRGAIALVTFNRPDSINAVNDQIRVGLPRALAAADADPAIRVIVLHGGEGRGFCAGADIKEARPHESAIAARFRHGHNPWVEALDRTTKPVIAAIHGFCMGAGMEIALACDVRIASAEARFSLPETGLGLIPGAGGTQRLHRIVGMGHALDLMLTGDRIDGREAHRIGLVSRLVAAPAELLDAALAVAERIAGKAPAATLLLKEAVRGGSDLPLSAGLALERNLFALLSATKDKAEAAKAFKERRPPVFVGE